MQKPNGGALVLVWPDHVGGHDMEMVQFDQTHCRAPSHSFRRKMESALTDFQNLVVHTPGAEDVDTSVVRGAVIAGTAASLGPKERKSFLRYRNGLHRVDVIAFNEVHDRLKGLRNMLATTVDEDI